MTEELNQDQAIPQGEPAGGQLQLQKIYTKDVSFEIPNAPQVFQEQGQAEVKLNLAQRVEDLGDNVEEIVLTVTVTGAASASSGPQSQSTPVMLDSGIQVSER